MTGKYRSQGLGEVDNMLLPSHRPRRGVPGLSSRRPLGGARPAGGLGGAGSRRRAAGGAVEGTGRPRQVRLRRRRRLRLSYRTQESGPSAQRRRAKYEGPFGTVYSSNITSVRETGHRQWKDDQIITAIRPGLRPNGERLIPVHPYPIFNGMAEEDLRAVVAYLDGAPVRQQTTPQKIPCPCSRASSSRPGSPRTRPARHRPPPRRQLAWLAANTWCAAVGHCGECHTPRGMTQAIDNRASSAATKGKRPEDSYVPNITPDKDTGIKWTEDQIAEFLATGNTPTATWPGGSWARSSTAPRRVQGHDSRRTASHRPLPQDHPPDQQQGRGLPHPQAQCHRPSGRTTRKGEPA